MKRKRNSKIISLLLAVMMILSSLPFAGISALAATSGDFEYEILDDGTAEITDYTGEAETLEIPATLDGYTVTSIGRYVFWLCDSLISVTIPSSVTSIGDYAFDGCSGLTSITIPDNVTSLGSSAFSNCDSLTSITIPDSVTSLGSSAFSNCDNLTNVDLGNSVTSIDWGVFEHCSSLTSITIPDSVTSIGNYAFDWCESLASVDIGKGVTSIGDYAFEGCSGLTSITIPNNVTSIGYEAFRGCENLTSADIGNGVTSIGDWAFSYCDSLTSVDLGNSVTSIGWGTFEHCSSLTSITIPDSVTSIGNYAFDFSALETIYGYENSYAQTYAEENGYEFVPLYTYENSESGITVDAVKSELPEDTKLVVTVKEETEDSITYDISLRSGDAEVQPTGSVFAKMPVPETMNGESVKVYRIEVDGTMTDMNALFKNGYMVFTMKRFGEYMMKAPSGEPGDVNDDGKINALDVLIIKRYIAKYEDAKLDGDMFARADVSGDGKVNAKDALAIMQKIAKLIDDFNEIK